MDPQSTSLLPSGYIETPLQAPYTKISVFSEIIDNIFPPLKNSKKLSSRPHKESFIESSIGNYLKANQILHPLSPETPSPKSKVY
ncbi:unnamed protein product [Brassica rapa subsp. trilocularis]